MGVADRQYMLDEDSYLDGTPGRRRSAVPLIIGVNIVVWIVWQFARNNPDLSDFMNTHFILSSYGLIKEHRFETLLTSAFSHIDLMHLAFNMFFFWQLGPDVERYYGARNFLLLYVFCAVVSAAVFVGGYLAVPRGGEAALGASGAVMGVALIAAIYHPNKPMSLYFIELKLGYLVFIYILIDLLGLTDHLSPVAHTAHLGGVLAGFIFWKLDLRLFASHGNPASGLLYRVRRWFRGKPSVRVYDDAHIPEPVAKHGPSSRAAMGSSIQRAPSSRSVDLATSRRVDELLGKISREGMGALTDEERKFLNDSSQKYRKQR